MDFERFQIFDKDFIEKLVVWSCEQNGSIDAAASCRKEEKQVRINIRSFERSGRVPPSGIVPL
jgi:hypothetical protein